MSQYRDRTNQRRMTIILGIVLTVAMGSSLVLPLLRSAATGSGAIEPTALPTATVPAPVDVTSIAFDQSYIHPSGIFTATIPEAWQPDEGVTTSSEAIVTLRNNAALSLGELRVIEPTDGVADLDAVSAYFNTNWLNSSWRDYASWDEATRDVRDDELVIDFNLSSRGQDYIARQIATTDGERIYVARAVFPENSPEQVRYLVENLKANLHFNDQFAGEPFDWTAYYDSTSGHIIRFPQTWQITDAAPGAPASIEGAGGIVLRVESADEAITSTDEAAAYIESTRPGAEIVSATETEHNGLSGYSVVYSLPTLDGPSQSGYALILTDENGNVHVANLRLNESDVDLTDAATLEQYPDIAAVLNSFTVLPSGLGVVAEQPVADTAG
ncbi:MAG: hypothetical protein KC615_06415 [Anaerolineae bacterium]|nr:hypothetical protein [Anaerolineae bacterium]